MRIPKKDEGCAYTKAIHKMEQLYESLPDNWLVVYNMGKLKYDEGVRTKNIELQKESEKFLKDAKRLLDKEDISLPLVLPLT